MFIDIKYTAVLYITVLYCIPYACQIPVLASYYMTKLHSTFFKLRTVKMTHDAHATRNK